LVNKLVIKTVQKSLLLETIMNQINPTYIFTATCPTSTLTSSSVSYLFKLSFQLITLQILIQIVKLLIIQFLHCFIISSLQDPNVNIHPQSEKPHFTSSKTSFIIPN